MTFPIRLRRASRIARPVLALLCAALLVPGWGATAAQDTAPAPGAAPAQPAAKIPPDQLDSLVAPIALYPDPLLAQTLVAATYPLEIIQLQQWLEKNKSLKDQALADAVAKQPWDPAIQSMAAFPEVVKRLGDDIQWTTDLGNAFLDQQSDVMDAVQRMRAKAQGTGALTSSEQQKVETQVIEQKTVIVVEPADPQVIYVPTYNPTVVYGPPIYPYPPVYYPPYWGAAAISFGVGMAVGAAWGGACCRCGWGHNNVNINVNNNFNRNANINTGGNNNWQHNSQHRGGAPYSNKATASKYGGQARGESRQASGSGGGASPSNRASGTGGGAGGAGASNRAGGGGGSSGGFGGSSSGGFGGSSGPSASNRSSPGGGGAGGSMSSGGFGGGSGGYSGSSAKASSSRGASSMSSSRGGGGGGGRGGGGRR